MYTPGGGHLFLGGSVRGEGGGGVPLLPRKLKCVRRTSGRTIIRYIPIACAHRMQIRTTSCYYHPTARIQNTAVN